MNFGIQDKVALVTAASRGLGRAAALQLSREGAKVAICARTEEAIEQTREEIAQETGGDVFAFAADVTNQGQTSELIRRVVDEFDTIAVGHVSDSR